MKMYLTPHLHPSSVPRRLEYAQVDPPKGADMSAMSEVDYAPPSKRRRMTDEASEGLHCHHTLEEVEHATFWLDSLLRQ